MTKAIPAFAAAAGSFALLIAVTAMSVSTTASPASLVNASMVALASAAMASMARNTAWGTVSVVAGFVAVATTVLLGHHGFVLGAELASAIQRLLAPAAGVGFIAYFAWNLARNAKQAQGMEFQNQEGSADSLALVKPLFFLAVFVDHMGYSFLPQYVQEMAAAGGIPSGWASAPFFGYYLCFAGVLVPAGRWEAKAGPRTLIWAGLIVAASGMLIVSLMPSFGGVLVGRSLSGLGQGAIFIGMQCYILAKAPPNGKTRGAAIIVLGFQAGMIAGTALGGQAFAVVGAQGVFAGGAMVAALAAAYTLTVVPHAASASFGGGVRSSGLLKDARAMMGDLRFMKSVALIGVPAKAVLTGVVLFAIPLILARRGFSPQDIGQVTALYAGAVIVSSSYASRLADMTGSTGPILSWGALGSGMGLGLLGLLEMSASGGMMQAGWLLALSGAAVLGLAHGLINAPVITHVTEAEVSNRLGAGRVASTYRLLERAGHMGGPIIAAQALLLFGETPATLAWMGGAVAALGLIFMLPERVVAEDAAVP